MWFVRTVSLEQERHVGRGPDQLRALAGESSEQGHPGVIG
jgi:hypothetical protein